MTKTALFRDLLSLVAFRGTPIADVSQDLVETPDRYVRALEELTCGYCQDPVAILAEKSFDGGGYDQVVVVRGIDFVSLCEHHVLPFVGTADVGYIPKERVCGLSKIPRAVEALARRLQIQERLTTQIAQAVEDALHPLGVAVVVRARHSCLGLRGARKPGVEMVTSDMRGCFRNNGDARSEFLRIAGA